MNVAAETLGCRLNKSDTALIFDRLKRVGFQVVSKSDDNIDLFIINSCSVTERATKKSRESARRIKKRHPNALVVLTGCSSVVDEGKILSESSIDLIVSDRKQILEKIKDKFAQLANTNLHNSQNSLTDNIFKENATAFFPFKSRAFLKIQEGCNNFCSYCIVPLVRGREKSRDLNEIIDEFYHFLEQGYKEIVLTGVNVSSYNFNGVLLSDLLLKLSAIKGDFRIRLSSTEPNIKNLDIIDVIAENSNICRYLHLSLQHGSDNILRLMQRKYTTKEYAHFANIAKSKIEGLHLGTDIIVGFPGETDNDFNESLRFVQEVNFANTHIFTYSPRANTPAAQFANQVSKDVARSRYDVLSKITKEQSAQFAKSFIGKNLEILTEQKQEGWSDNYLKVKVANCATNQFVSVKIKEYKDGILA